MDIFWPLISASPFHCLHLADFTLRWKFISCLSSSLCLCYLCGLSFGCLLTGEIVWDWDLFGALGAKTMKNTKSKFPCLAPVVPQVCKQKKNDEYVISKSGKRISSPSCIIGIWARFLYPGNCWSFYHSMWCIALQNGLKDNFFFFFVRKKCSLALFEEDSRKAAVRDCRVSISKLFYYADLM